MSLFFMGVLKLSDDAHRDLRIGGSPPAQRELARRLTSIALEHGYGIQINHWNISVFFRQSWGKPLQEWINRAIELLGGREGAMPFHLLSSPADDLAHDIFVHELEAPVDWTRVKLPNFLMQVWQEPTVRAALFLRKGVPPILPLDALPPPTSLYSMLDTIVQLRAWDTERADVSPNAAFYLVK